MDRAYQRIVTELLDDVVSGELATGAWLPAVQEIAARFACSPATAREAIRALQERGVVDVQPGQGQRVLAEDRWDLLDHDVAAALLLRDDGPTGVVAQAVEALRAVETQAAMLAAQRIRPGDLGLLVDDLERMRASSASDLGPAQTGDGFVEAEASFHRTLMQLSGNRFMATMLASLHPVLATARRRRAPDRDAVAVRLHERIVTALAARDTTASAAAVDGYGRRLAGWLRG